jgi:hypothetical protein
MRHHHIQNQQIRILVSDRFQRLEAVASFQNPKTSSLQHQAEQVTGHRFIINN